ncbi:Coenzyme PQQ synthesis protein A [Burkholderia diffusa]|nr:Coenzyme PQQ synthesis protein A [Burkholderia diffusa]
MLSHAAARRKSRPGTLLAEWVSAARSMRFFRLTHSTRRHIMQWTTPAYTDLRFGFEITMYIANR